MEIQSIENQSIENQSIENQSIEINLDLLNMIKNKRDNLKTLALSYKKANEKYISNKIEIQRKMLFLDKKKDLQNTLKGESTRVLILL